MPNKRLKRNNTTTRDNEEEGVEIDELNNEELMVDFEARLPLDSDYDSIKLLLNQKLTLFNLNIGELSELIIEESNLNNIGNVIYQSIEDEGPLIATNNNEQDDDDDDDYETIFGIMSCLNINKLLNKQSIKRIIELINVNLIKDKELINKLKLKDGEEDLFNKYKIGYLINERFINLPSTISIPMFNSLINDDLKNKINDFDYFMLITKSIKDNNNNDDLIFIYQEEEFFYNESSFIINLSSSFNKEQLLTNDNKLIKFNCLFLNKDNLLNALNKIKQSC